MLGFFFKVCCQILAVVVYVVECLFEKSETVLKSIRLNKNISCNFLKQLPKFVDTPLSTNLVNVKNFNASDQMN